MTIETWQRHILYVEMHTRKEGDSLQTQMDILEFIADKVKQAYQGFQNRQYDQVQVAVKCTRAHTRGEASGELGVTSASDCSISSGLFAQRFDC